MGWGKHEQQGNTRNKGTEKQDIRGGGEGKRGTRKQGNGRPRETRGTRETGK